MNADTSQPNKSISDLSIRFIGFLAFFDRFGMPPMLLFLAEATRLSVAQAVELVAGYALFYALGQPIWGILSDRFGRLTVLRLALLGAVIGSLASMLFIDYAPLLAARCFTGLMFGALYPTLLTVLGDSRTGIARARALSDLQIYSSLGTTLATLGAGIVAAYIDFRVVFLLPGLGCLAALISLRTLRESRTAMVKANFAAALRAENFILYALVFVEGALLTGLLTYIVPALQEAGVSVALAGVLGCGFAVGVILGARLMRRLVARYSRTTLIALGTGVLALCFLPSALWPTPVPLTITALGLGAANAIMHSSMQGWATDLTPEARATTVSLFVFALFFGASAITYVTADWAADSRYPWIFALGLALGLLLLCTAPWFHARWKRRQASV